MSPLISIVIPTYGRPKYLERAIRSAIEAYGDSCEVLVVPNGNDLGWKDIAEHYKNDPRIKFIYSPIANGNAARNLGLHISKGKYIRFLDDDDYFYPESADEQLKLMILAQAEVCSGKLSIKDDLGKDHGYCSFPEENDFIIACSKISGITLPTANIYLKKILENISWDEDVKRAQDYIFLLDLVRQEKDFKWLKYPRVVGVWYQHAGERVSASVTKKKSYMPWVFDRLFQGILFFGDKQQYKRQQAFYEAFWVFIRANYYDFPDECQSFIEKGHNLDLNYDNKMGLWPRKIFGNRVVGSIINKYPLAFLRGFCLMKGVLNPFLKISRKNVYVRKV
ncbi:MULTISPECIES: glycosyltransferase family 2 protein [Acinetobacter calcoaceticus/baumannii complex]|jgi:glycosyltransferase involved in cell wall biosynthesis|uniref:Gtr189 n=1 Tax=Acinetobacter baumannii TaxID=470 RepID=A0A481WWI2_ACIBA|nr:MULTISPECIES: glycosyltransferase family 2 protein [Acinetobacter calcoaceticus/baumannii complex]QBK17819.1 Gtr189 [Acinetobacter baumannii]EXE25491.1 glycosyl transferase 2 family protein [Acinetobacter sp. 907131]EXH34808.1 glycosyl transferase 2 family protein [Acinetobacter sp. 1245249]EYT28208.1 glycosyl transferase 2 family protein [Acinetobacter sp. 1564232]HAV5308881.1 glycosyltransferase family 2 protein [Acinetobacter baumannii]